MQIHPLSFPLVLACLLAVVPLTAEEQNPVGTDSSTESTTVAVAKKAMISEYHFFIKGRTSERAIRSRIVPDGDEIFDSEEQLRNALENKRQTLKNLRIFRSVDYEYKYVNESASMRFYDVEFTIVDGGAKLPFPYAKYDSNYGLKAGARIYDKNLLGQMADLYFNADMEQYDNSFDEATYYGELAVNKVFLTRNVQMDLNSKFNYDKHDADNSYFKFNVLTRGIKIDNKPLTLNEWVELAPQKEDGVYDNGNSWKFEEIGNSIFFGPFALNIGGYSVYNQIVDYHDDTGTSDWERLQTYTQLNFHGLKLWGKQLDSNISLNTIGEEEGVLHKARIGETLGMNFRLFNYMNWYTSFSQYHTMYPKHAYGEDYPHTLYEMSFGLYSSLSRSSINYVTDDFRKGLDFRFTYRNENYVTDEHDGIKYRDYSYQNFAFQFTYFWYPSHWINPSIRFTAGINNYHTRPYDDNKAIPNDRYFYPDDTSAEITEYMRGIRDDNKYARIYETTWGDDINDVSWAAVLNVNMTMQFIKFGDFAHTLINPFVDVGVFKKEPANDAWIANYSKTNAGEYIGDAEVLVSAGLEGIGIIDSHPAYPVRLSVGVNMNQIFHKIKGDIDGGLEYEIYFGMYHFF